MTVKKLGPFRGEGKIRRQKILYVKAKVERYYTFAYLRPQFKPSSGTAQKTGRCRTAVKLVFYSQRIRNFSSD